MVTPAPIPITVIGGYLGVGKTTLLNRLLAQSAGRRLGVVVNDFGELGIDATLLQASIDDTDDVAPPVVNLANGCVCCTLGDDLRSTLEMLGSIAPRLDHIVIEASGVADPAAAAAWGTVPGFAPGGVVVLAAADSVMRSARDRYVGAEVVRQLEGADLVVVTKVDLVGSAETARVHAWLAATCDAAIIEAESGRIGVEIVLGPPLGATVGSDAVSSATSHGVEDGPYVRWSTDTGVVPVEQLDRFLTNLPDGVLRLKGFVEVQLPTGEVSTRLVQVVGRSVTVGLADRAGPRALEAIGVAGVLDLSSLEALAADYLRGS